MARAHFLNALSRETPGVPASGPVTSIVTTELMDQLGVYFPEAHLDAEQMTRLAETGHTIMGYDVVMPLFSVCHDSAAIGCNIDWGDKSIMPQTKKPIWQSDEDVQIPADYLQHKAAQVPIKSIRQLKKRLGEDAAVCGKVFGPWTLGYHTFGIETWLISTITDPDMVKRSIDKMKQITISFAKAQLDAGADCMMIADHATRDLCSPDAYREFLKELHAEFAETIPCLSILHICGDTSDRIGMIAETGLACFHWDTKLGDAKRARELAGERLSLMGGINNTEVLRLGTIKDIEQMCQAALDGGTDIVAPECAVPLDAPIRNLKAIGDFIEKKRWAKHSGT